MLKEEVVTWFVLSFVFFFIFNSGLRLRTAASLFLSIFSSTIVCSIIFYSVLSETMIFFTAIIAVIFAVFKALREKRDDENVKPK